MNVLFLISIQYLHYIIYRDCWELTYFFTIILLFGFTNFHFSFGMKQCLIHWQVKLSISSQLV